MSSPVTLLKLGFRLPSWSKTRRDGDDPLECARIRESGLFDEAYYRSAYPDVAQAGIDPLLHFVLHGNEEGRNPSAFFATRLYKRRHSLSNNQNPLLHYLKKPLKQTIPPAVGNIDIAEWRLDDADIEIASPPLATNIGVFIHLFYEDLVGEILDRVANIPVRFRLYISTDTVEKRQLIEAALIERSLKNTAVVKVLPNRGWDVAPFLVGFADEIMQHDICLKLHAKKSTYQAAWAGRTNRRHLLRELIGHPALVMHTITHFLANPEVGVVMPNYWENVRPYIAISRNFSDMERVLGRLGISILPDQRIEFPCGSMFWFRSAALAPILSLKLGWDDFEPTETAPRDGTLAHAMERLPLFSAARAGLRWMFSPSASVLAEICDKEPICPWGVRAAALDGLNP